MTSKEALQKYGFPALPGCRNAIRKLLTEEIERERREESDDGEMLRTLCVQLFSLGIVEDTLLIWEAKESSFDAHCGLDVQLLCGAGIVATKAYLEKSGESAASAALEYLISCEQAGDFDGWTPQTSIDEFRKYYG